MAQLTPIWPHGKLEQIFPNIYFVMGTNITTHEGIELQHSRNMVIVKQDNELTLINTVRLNEPALARLDELGKVTNVVKIGAFHGRDDAFYLERYQAQFWDLPKLSTKLPFPNCALFVFETSIHPEGILYLQQNDGILITCDSIKNWIRPDPFFSEQTAALYEKLGFFGCATISNIWLQATQVQVSDFEKLKLLSFRHLISAHGEPLLDQADHRVKDRIKNVFRI